MSVQAYLREALQIALDHQLSCPSDRDRIGRLILCLRRSQFEAQRMTEDWETWLERQRLARMGLTPSVAPAASMPRLLMSAEDLLPSQTSMFVS